MDYSELLDIGLDAAKSALEIIESEKQSLNKIEKNLTKDVKIFADTKSEKIIIDYLNKSTDFSILAEESGFINKSSEYMWIVDPVDGSVNFSREIPFYSISIGLWKNGVPVLGIIYDLTNNDIYKGVVGQGAWYNEKKIKTSIVNKIDDAIICTGFPVSHNFLDAEINSFIQKIKNFKKVRLFGSASLSLAFLAKGSVDAYSEKNIKLWDVAAGIAIVIAAGGVVEFSKIDNSYKLTVTASSNKFLNY
ncbi:inositol monophosphatase [Flavobacteriaceae bacterium]|nr:inositol monophosphatase [Flavobacteriaceae bacterium]